MDDHSDTSLTVPVVPGIVLLGPLLVRLVDELILGLGLASDRGAKATNALVGFYDLGTEAGIIDRLGHGGERHDDVGPRQVVDVLVAVLVSVDVARGGVLLLVIYGDGAGGKLGSGGGLSAVSLGAQAEGRRL